MADLLDITTILGDYIISIGKNNEQLGKHLVLTHKNCTLGSPMANHSDITDVILFMVEHSSNCSKKSKS